MNTVGAYLATRAPIEMVPNPSPSAPPGAEQFGMVLNWVFWIALACGVLGFMIAGIMMMLQSSGRMGADGGQLMGRVAWVAIGLIIVAAASGLTSMIV